MGHLALIKFLLDAIVNTTADDASACDSHRRRSVDLPDLFSCQTSSLGPTHRTAALSGYGLHRTDLCPMFSANFLPLAFNIEQLVASKPATVDCPLWTVH